MPRSQFTDFLLNNKFHLLDVSISIPPVLIPVWGFSSITAPEMTMQYREIKEGNYEFPRKVLDRSSVSTITLENGSQLFNSGFWDWISKVPEGNMEKKNLMLVHFTGINFLQFNSGRKYVVKPLNLSTNIGGRSVPLVQGEVAPRIPGKAWLLKACSPGRYKAGSDFSASGAEVSLQQLDIEYEEFLEFNVGVG